MAANAAVNHEPATRGLYKTAGFPYIESFDEIYIVKEYLK